MSSEMGQLARDIAHAYCKTQIRRARPKLAWVSGTRPAYRLNIARTGNGPRKWTARELTAIAEFWQLADMHFTCFRAAQNIANAINLFARVRS